MKNVFFYQINKYPQRQKGSNFRGLKDFPIFHIPKKFDIVVHILSSISILSKAVHIFCQFQ